MIVYRITKKAHADLTGLGGLYGRGRWHKKGNLVVYASENASLAAFETIVHVASFRNMPHDLVLMKIGLPDHTKISTVPESVLVRGWNGFPFCDETIDFGTSFLHSKENLLLKVPSVIIPDEFNFLINPLHPEIKNCKVISISPFTFDIRIVTE
jgi:RES domain-containing protein